MITHTKPPFPVTAPTSATKPSAVAWQTPPADTPERLRRIEALAQWINGYAQFMCQAGNPNAASSESTDRAVVVFYEQMVLMERKLARILEEFRLE